METNKGPAELEAIHKKFEETDASEPPDETPASPAPNIPETPAAPAPPKSPELLKLEHMAIFNAAMMANTGVAGVHCLVYNLTHKDTEVSWEDCELDRIAVEEIVKQDLPEDAKKFLLEFFPPWLTSVINIEKRYIKKMDAAAKPKQVKKDDTNNPSK